MDRFPLPPLSNDLQNVVERLIREAQGNVLILTSAPTAAQPILTENQRGYFNNKIYQVLNGTLYEQAVTATA